LPRVLLVAVGTLLAGCAAGETVWLLIGASGRSPAHVAARSAELQAEWPQGLTVDMADCGQAAGMLALALAVSADPASAETLVPRARARIPDAYTKRCEVVPQSRLAFRIPAVHPSVGRVPADSVNWTDVDRVSTLERLGDAGFILRERVYQADPEDAREGRRERVYFFRDDPDARVQLSEDCWDYAGQADDAGRIAFQCARETAADHFLHSTFVVSLASGQVLREVSHCRNPWWISEDRLSCYREEVDADGRLRLQPVELSVASPGSPAPGGDGR
jgi:hypothetical protein